MDTVLMKPCRWFQVDCKFLYFKVFLDPKEHSSRELETFSAVYRKLSGKDVVFEYPVTEAWEGAGRLPLSPSTCRVQILELVKPPAPS
ncbi:hypothetical protein NC651_033570 [Populus alba x Populus x berolinensis]|nr:hypothetical protein NC651_033565 [Populus alba x Populus x berolinensis]KAJ6868529.1 hypothetical protein NC651_033570 [Populus alba x Populus x berolinensis]